MTARLLAGAGVEPVNHERHCSIHGPALRFTGLELRRQLADSGLRGRGGAAFPLARKVEAVRRRRGGAVLVVNGCEGKPMSAKDGVVLRSVPHLLIDGMLALAEAIQARRIVLALEQFDVSAADAFEHAVTERSGRAARPDVEIVHVPQGYVSSQETALVNWINNGTALPTVAPPRVSDRGVSGQPTLVSNVETIAHVGVIARHGARFFREAGTSDDPGTALISLGGAVAAPGVYEIEHGFPLLSLLRQAGGARSGIAAVLVGGYAGGWVSAERLERLRLDRASVDRAGARLGAGIVTVLPVGACPVAETARVANWMAQQSARQCGPCRNGLDAVADALDDVRQGQDGRRALADVARWSGQIVGRGACSHPDGAVGLIVSALRNFRPQFLDHAAHGNCDGCERPSMLELPAYPAVRRRR